MEAIGYVFAMSALSFGLLGFVLGADANTKVDKLEKKLLDAGVLEKEVDS